MLLKCYYYHYLKKYIFLFVFKYCLCSCYRNCSHKSFGQSILYCDRQHLSSRFMMVSEIFQNEFMLLLRVYQFPLCNDQRCSGLKIFDHSSMCPYSHPRSSIICLTVSKCPPSIAFSSGV